MVRFKSRRGQPLLTVPRMQMGRNPIQELMIVRWRFWSQRWLATDNKTYEQRDLVKIELEYHA